MSIGKYLESAPLYRIRKYDRHEEYLRTAVQFSGAPRKHPYDRTKILLVRDPFSERTYFYEFKLEDILHAEDLPNLVTRTGESLPMMKIWVKKGSIALKFFPFEVTEGEASPPAINRQETRPDS